MPTPINLRIVPLFAGLSEDQMTSLASRFSKRTFAKGMIIFHKGSIGQNLYLIESGKVRIFLLSEAGQEVCINIYGPGQVFGEMSLLDGLPRSAGAMAMEQTVTHTLHRKDFINCLDSCPVMASGVMSVLCARLRYVTEYAESLAFLDVYGRVGAKLLELAERYGVPSQSGLQIELRMTQSELATWVAATREFVNKVLGSFRDQGLITVDGKKITVIDPDGLKRRITY